MHRRGARRTAALAALALTVAVTAGCTAGDAETAPTPRPSTTATSTPSPTPTYAVPDTVPGEIARVVHTPDGGEDDSPVTAMTASDAVVADEPFTLRGDCIGESVDYSVVTAAVDDNGRVLVEGTLECGEGTSPAGYSTPYSGLVQVMLASTDDVEYAWLIVAPG